MPVQFLGEDDQSFTVDSGNGPQQVAKTPDMMAPGGIYDQAKAAVSAPPEPDAPMGISAPPPPTMTTPPPIVPPPVVPPPPTATTQTAQPDQPIVPAPMPQIQQQQQQMPPMMQMGTSGTNISSNVVDPKARGAYTGAMNDEAKAIEAQGQIKGGLEANLATNDAEKARVLGEQAGVNQGKAEMIDKVHQEYQQKVADEMQKLSLQKVQPKPIFADGDIGQNIAAGLAIGLGALGQAMTGGRENVGLTVIQTAIDRDMKAQQANIDNKRGALNDLGIALKAGLDMGMSQKDAQLHAKADALLKVGAQGEQMGHQSGSQMAIQNGLQFGAAARAASADTLLKATATQVQRSSTSQDVRTPLPKLDPTEKKEIISYKNNDDAIQDMRDYVKSAFGEAPTGKAADMLRETGKRFGIQDPNVAVLQQKMKAQFIAHNHEMFGSRITDPEIKQMAEVLPSYEDNPATWEAKLNEMDRTNAQKYGVARGTTGGVAEGFRYPELRSPYWEQYRGGGPTSNSTYTPAQQTTMNPPQTHHRK